MEDRMATMSVSQKSRRLITAAALALTVATPAMAQWNSTTMPLGGGWSTTHSYGPNGQSLNSTTAPLGGGWTTTNGYDSNGRSFSCTSAPIGSGFTTNCY
jgi:spore germination protein YaaH